MWACTRSQHWPTGCAISSRRFLATRHTRPRGRWRSGPLASSIASRIAPHGFVPVVDRSETGAQRTTKACAREISAGPWESAVYGSKASSLNRASPSSISRWPTGWAPSTAVTQPSWAMLSEPCRRRQFREARSSLTASPGPRPARNRSELGHRCAPAWTSRFGTHGTTDTMSINSRSFKQSPRPTLGTPRTRADRPRPHGDAPPRARCGLCRHPADRHRVLSRRAPHVLAAGKACVHDQERAELSLSIAAGPTP